MHGIAETLHEVETGPSITLRLEEYFEPDCIVQRFVQLLQCNSSACEEVISISGNIEVEYVQGLDHKGNHFEDYRDRYVPIMMSPPPMPILLPDNVPSDIFKSISDAAALLWLSEESSANKIRTAIEHLLTYKGTIKTKIVRGKRKRLTLHERIEIFRQADYENGDILLATKWIGNAGSHTGALARSDLLDAFDMLELVFENLFGNTKQKLLKKVRQVNKDRGVRKPRT